MYWSFSSKKSSLELVYEDVHKMKARESRHITFKTLAARGVSSKRNVWIFTTNYTAIVSITCKLRILKKKLNSFLRHNVYFCIQMQPFQRQASENTEIYIIALKTDTIYNFFFKVSINIITIQTAFISIMAYIVRWLEYCHLMFQQHLLPYSNTFHRPYCPLFLRQVFGSMISVKSWMKSL